MQGIPRPLVRVNQSFIFVFSVFGMMTGLHTLLLIPFIVGIHALLTKRNLLFKWIQPLLKKEMNEYPMEDPEQQRFNQTIAVVCVGLAWIFFTTNLNTLGYVFGILVALASGIALCGFCIGCFIHYRLRMWRYNRSRRQ